MKAFVWSSLMTPPTSRHVHGRAVIARLAVTLGLVFAVALLFSWLGRS